MKRRARRGDLSGDGIVGEKVVRGEEIETGEGSRGGAGEEGRQPHPEEKPHRGCSLAIPFLI